MTSSRGSVAIEVALKLRPTGLGSGVDKDRPDYTVFTGECEIGRIYQTRDGRSNRTFAGADRGAAKARRRARANRPSEWGIGGGVPLLKVGTKSGVLRMLFIW
jgi:hypothetical protein